jgi:hypothetical protein
VHFLEAFESRRCAISAKHQLEEQFALSATEILSVIQSSNRTLIAVRGAVAQEHLRRYFEELKNRSLIVDYRAIDEDGKPDFAVNYRGREYLIECKNVQKTMRKSEVTVDFMRTRYAKTEGPQGRFYKCSEFQILAACLYNQLGVWKFKFISTHKLASHPQYLDRLDNKVSLGASTAYYSAWQDDLSTALDMVP